jgi:hypothetical protein
MENINFLCKLLTVPHFAYEFEGDIPPEVKDVLSIFALASMTKVLVIMTS